MENLYDVIIVGGGPAGLTAAIYLARANCRVLVMEQDAFGGQITITDQVVNYPGIPAIAGSTLAENLRRQAEAFGAEFLNAAVHGLTLDGAVRQVHSTAGDYSCLGILLATGAQPRTVGFQGEQQFKGRGVAYCATCDGEFFTGCDVYVVGGGYAAAEESVFLTRFARHVTVLIRREGFSCAASVAEQALHHEKITVLPNRVLEKVSGEQMVTGLSYKNTVTGEVTEVTSPQGERLGVFVFAGYRPATEFLKGVVALDAQGYIITDATQRTSIEGVYGAGDVCIKPLRQVVTATGDGAIAATELEKYVTRCKQEKGLQAAPPKRKPVIEGKTTQQDGPFTPELRQQLNELFSKLESPMVLELHLDQRPVSGEVEAFAEALCALTPKLSLSVVSREADSREAPWISICREGGEETGLAFHGVPTGHEFTPFVLGVYHGAGLGRSLDAASEAKIGEIQRSVEMKILVSLSCTMCPQLVTAAQRIAAKNPNVTAHVYDIRYFEELREKYQVMSVPCLVVNGQVSFGKKSIEQVLEMIENAP